MTIDLIKFAFVAGEISPNYFGRPDLEKFDLALALGENWFVDYRGGVSTRPGTEFLDYIKDDTQPIKLFDFKFSSDIANTYVLVLSNQAMRFVQDGAYVLETNIRNITSLTAANPGVITTSANHGYQNGDWVKIAGVVGPKNINGETFVVANKTNTTFQLQDTFGNNYNTTALGAYVSGGTVQRIYTISTPWDAVDLADLRAHQIRDNIRFTHKNHQTRNLVRSAHTSWTLSALSLSNNVAIPVITNISSANSGSWAAMYCVTAVNTEGQESLASTHVILNSTELEDNRQLTWTPIPGIVSYNVYRSRMTASITMTKALTMGFIGRSAGANFVDANVTPDFTRTPPRGNDPFASSQIEYIDVLTGGTGYTINSSMTVIDGGGGTGFVGDLLTTTSLGGLSQVTGVAVRRGGSGYTGISTVTISGPGSGATFTIHRSPLGGNYPAVGTIFQQRQVFAATENEPLTIYGSRPLRLTDFGVSEITVADDSYEHEIDSDALAPIRHLLPTRGGLIVMNEVGIWLLSGTAGRAVTAIDAQADSQAYKGATELVPLKIDTDLLYQEGSGGSVRLLSYNDINKVYSGVDMSVLANHLFGPNKKISAWAYSDEPFKLIWAQREDGTGLCFTMLKEQSVFAWMRQTTKGFFRDMIAVQEDNRAVVYTVVERFINGRWTKLLERLTQRDFTHVEEAVCVDSSLKLGATYGTTNLTIAAVTGDDVVVTSSGAYFAPGDVNKILRACGGKMKVITYVNNVTVHVKVLRELTEVIPQTDPALPSLALAGTWTLDTPVTTLSGLRHLEGQTVKVLADGNVQNDKVVTNGQITLDQAATRVIIGLKYRCLLKTLPPNVSGAVIEDKRKRIPSLAARIRETRGIKFGKNLNHLYPMKERTTEAWGEPTLLQEGMKTLMLEPQWDVESQLYIVQEEPLPATLLGFVMNLDVGDDDNSRAPD